MNVIIFINKHHVQKKGFSSWEAFLLSYYIMCIARYMAVSYIRIATIIPK